MNCPLLNPFEKVSTFFLSFFGVAKHLNESSNDDRIENSDDDKIVWLHSSWKRLFVAGGCSNFLLY